MIGKKNSNVTTLDTGEVQFTVPIGGGKVVALLMDPEDARVLALVLNVEADRAESVGRNMVAKGRYLN